MKEILVVSLLFSVVFFMGAAAAKPDAFVSVAVGSDGVAWIGPLPVGSKFNGEVDGFVAVMPKIEMGLRKDGVVVWRKVP